MRAVSLNTTLLQAAALLAPAGVSVVFYNGLGDLPHFNPDLDREGEVALPAVARFRAQLNACGGVLICSPEYAHGVPGVLKNALDWVVGSGEFMNKPVALLNTSPRSIHAQAALREILTTMDARVVPEASIPIALAGRKLDAAGIVADPELSGALRTALAAFSRALDAAAAPVL